MRHLLLTLCSVFFLGAGCVGAPSTGTTTTVSPAIPSAPAQTASGTRYILTSPEQCMRARYACQPGEEAFSDAHGCGCKVIQGGDVPPTGGDHQMCPEIYQPVCGEVEVQCIRAPCPPLKQTFSNRCFADVAKAKNITSGACR